jgi:hypothetical protein
MTPEDHATLLRAFEVDRLLKLLTLEAKKHHDGHYAIFACTTGYQVAFGTPTLDSEKGRRQLAALPRFLTLKEALIAALVAAKTFADYGEKGAQRPGREALVAAMLTFTHHGRSYCQGRVLWSDGGTSPVWFACECGAKFPFADWSPGNTHPQDDPIGQAILHIHTVHGFPLKETYQMFKAFPRLGVVLAPQQQRMEANAHRMVV